MIEAARVPQRRRRERPLAFYYLLAFLTCAVTAGGLWLLHSVEEDYRAALFETEEWQAFLDEASKLEDLLDGLEIDALSRPDAASGPARLGQVIERLRAGSSHLIDELNEEEITDAYAEVRRAIPAVR